MRDADLVVADTSPLLGLALIDRLELVGEQFSTIIVPEQVWEELLAGEDSIDALQTLHDDGTLDIVGVEEASLFAEFRSELDALRSAGFWISDTLYDEILELANDDLE